MKTHLLNERHYKNLNVHPEEMVNISVCGKEVDDWNITTLNFQVTCKTCLKLIEER